MNIGEQVIVLFVILAVVIGLGFLQHQVELLDARITNIEMAK